MPPNFGNTEIAFQSKSNHALRQSYWLFRLIDHPWLVWFGTRLVAVALKLHLPVEGLIKRTIFRQFCGGETIEECQETIHELSKFGIGTILDYSVEGKGAESDFDATAHEIVRTVELAKGNSRIPFCVFKVTGIARFELLESLNDGSAPKGEQEKEEWERVKARMVAICERAFRYDVRVFVDAEESWIQNTIDRLATQMMERFNQERPIVYNTLQMYRSDRLQALRAAIGSAREKKYHYGVKLVRGAYMEKERVRAARLGVPSPILPEKSATDANYNAALTVCLENLDDLALCVGTHNEESVKQTMVLMSQRALKNDDSRIYFSQLLGMSDYLSYNLAAHGYQVAKYVPYGPVKEVMPYLFRRAEENTSIQGQSSRERLLLEQEYARRKQLR